MLKTFPSPLNRDANANPPLDFTTVLPEKQLIVLRTLLGQK